MLRVTSYEKKIDIFQPLTYNGLKFTLMAIPAKRKKSNGFRPVFRDIFSCSQKELAPFATVFVAPAENFEQQQLGTLFGILRVDDYSESSSYVVNLLTSVMKKEYFGHPHRSSEESFEASLRKANLALAELARHGATAWAGKINFVGGAIERNNLHFTCLGDVSVFLIRGDQLADISEELEEEKESESHPLKTFSNVSSGKLEHGDKLVFTTSELTDIFSQEELRRNARHFSREEFPGFLEISLGANSELACAIVVDITAQTDAKATVIDAPLIGKETIRKIDSPGIAAEVPEHVPAAHHPPAEAPRGPGAIFPQHAKGYGRQPGEAPASGPMKTSTVKFRAYAEKILSFSKNAFRNVSTFSAKTFSKIYQAFSRRKLKEKFGKPHLPLVSRKEEGGANRFASVLGAFSSRGRNLARNGFPWKTGAAAAGIVLVILAIFLFRNSASRQEPAPEPAVQNSQQNSEPQPLDETNLKSIGNIEEVATVAQIPARMSMLNDSLYTISGTGKSITKIDPANKSTEELNSGLNTGNFIRIAAMPDLATLFMLTEDNKVASLTPINKNFQENSISLPQDLNAADMQTYLTYIYFLDPDKNQIYRYPRSEGGFGETQNWLRNGADVKAAKSFTINDDLFTASGTELTAYLQGKKDEKVDFEKPNVALSAEKIYSEPGFSGIYVLDGKNHRIIQYSKDGKIVAQFWSADISAILDFVVDEKNKTIYLAKENKLLKFSME